MAKAKALFLDRDGVINIDHGYVYKQEQFDFCDGIFSLCRRAQTAGYLLIVVTNQSGVARGYFSEEQVNDLHSWMCEEFLKESVTISAVYHCPYHPEHGNAKYRKDSEYRKPKPGMLLTAQREFDLDLAKSIMVGDKISDMLAAKAAGLGRTILLRSRYVLGNEIEEGNAEYICHLDEISF